MPRVEKEICPRAIAFAQGPYSSSSTLKPSVPTDSKRGKTRRGTKHTPRHKPTLGNPSSGPQGVSVGGSKESLGSSVCAGVRAGGLTPPGARGSTRFSPTRAKTGTGYLVRSRSRSKTPNIVVISRSAENLPNPLGPPISIKPLSQ